MMKLLIVTIMFLALTVIGKARHIHPSNSNDWEDPEFEINRNQDIVEIVDGMPIEVIRKIKPTRFVPINNVLFFKTYPPCEEGFKRDLLGICREVWE